MIKHKGWWLPDGEREIVTVMDQKPPVNGRGQYQYNKLALALKQVRRFRTAVDGGAHVGLWSWHLAARFQRVAAFEPVPAHRECFQRNVTAAHVELHACALGSPEQMAEAPAVTMHFKPHHSGATRVTLTGSPNPIQVPLRTLDSFGLMDVDFVKLDLEGFEFHALQGAEATLARCQPVLIVEAKPDNAERFGLRNQQALEWLLAHGYRITSEISGDFILRSTMEVA